MTKTLDNVVVVGGGSAGWITALMVKARIPSSNVTVIESSEIGILGAGEGTTPMFINFLNYVNISINDLITNCNATFKNALKFTNWNGDNQYFYHNFAPSISEADSFSSFHNIKNFGKYNTIHEVNVLLNTPANESDFVSFLNEYNKVGQFNQGFGKEYKQISKYGVHFDATLLANFLKKTGIDRGINVVEGTINRVISKDNGDILELLLNSGEKIKLDFVFDCSGFHRLIIGNHFKQEWVSLEEHLKCDSALPFFAPITESIPPYTECVAMKYGWIWKIPLQNRFGCGYVFDSSFISEDEAAKEIEEYLGYTPEYPRKNKGSFKFKAGYYSNTWVNNCIAVGLASSFVEPLEATSIGNTIVNLSMALSNPWRLTNRSDADKKIYNTQFVKLMEETGAFLYMHYMTKRKDTNFWLQFKDKSLSPKRLKNLLDLSENHVLDAFDIDRNWDAFNYSSFMEVGLGVQLLEVDKLKNMALFNNPKEQIKKDYLVFMQQLKDIANQCVDHNYLLKDLGGLK